MAAGLTHFESPVAGSVVYETGTDGTQPSNAVIFIGGLGDGPHTVVFANKLGYRLADPELDYLNYALFQVRTRSSFSGYGYSSLANDVADISALVKHLRRSRGMKKIVLLGHSTGSQDCMEYANYAKHRAAPVDGFILQGPVSDREGLVGVIPPEVLARTSELATRMILEGRQDDCLPRAEIEEWFPTPITAYRWDSLIRKGGDDDYFSSDLDADFLRKVWGRFKKPVLVLHSEKDEHVPERVSQRDLLDSWRAAAKPGIISPLSEPIPGADHSVTGKEAREWLEDTIIKFLACEI